MDGFDRTFGALGIAIIVWVLFAIFGFMVYVAFLKGGYVALGLVLAFFATWATAWYFWEG